MTCVYIKRDFDHFLQLVVFQMIDGPWENNVMVKYQHQASETIMMP